MRIIHDKIVFQHYPKNFVKKKSYLGVIKIFWCFLIFQMLSNIPFSCLITRGWKFTELKMSAVFESPLLRHSIDIEKSYTNWARFRAMHLANLGESLEIFDFENFNFVLNFFYFPFYQTSFNFLRLFLFFIKHSLYFSYFQWFLLF
jgi:hypothetical protein